MDQCLFLIQYHIIIGCFLSIFVSYLTGKFFDSVQAKISLSVTFMIGVLMQVALFFSTPGQWSFYVTSALFHVQVCMKMVSMRAYTQRMIPKEIRTTILANLSLSTSLAELGMVQILYFAFKTFGTSFPFLVAALFDLITLLAILLLNACSLIDNSKGHAD